MSGSAQGISWFCSGATPGGTQGTLMPEMEAESALHKANSLIPRALSNTFDLIYYANQTSNFFHY